MLPPLNHMQSMLHSLMASQAAGPILWEPFQTFKTFSFHSKWNPLTGRPPCSKLERDLLGLLVRLGSMGLTNPVTLSTNAFQTSQCLTAPLAALIITQQIDQTTDPGLTCSPKNSIHRENRQLQDQQAKDIYAQLTPQLKRCVDLAVEKGSSSWFTALPLPDHGFFLHKG